jgi:putative Holliday junction resolvase
LAEVLRSIGTVPVILWDEYGSTAAVKETQRLMNLPRKKRQEHHDDLAAAVILQSYLNAQSQVEDS